MQPSQAARVADVKSAEVYAVFENGSLDWMEQKILDNQPNAAEIKLLFESLRKEGDKETITQAGSALCF